LPALGLRDALARWQAGQKPAVGPADCYRAAQVIDEAYAIARNTN